MKLQNPKRVSPNKMLLDTLPVVFTVATCVLTTHKMLYLKIKLN